MTRNSYYYTVRRVKRSCWNDVLQRAEEVQDTVVTGTNPKTQSNHRYRQMRDTERCWMTLWYIKPLMSSTTPGLTDLEGYQPTTLKDKDVIVRRTAFLEPPKHQICPRSPRTGIAHCSVDTETLRLALYDQSQKKSP